MADIPFSIAPLAVVSSLLLVLVVCVVLLVLQRHRRAGGVEVRAVEPDRVEPAGHDAVPTRRIVDVQHLPLRRAHGRHSAELPAPSGVMLLLLVPTVVKRRRPPLDAPPAIESSSTGPDDDAALVTDLADLADLVDPAVAAADDIHVYRRRVSTTIQAISRRTGPGDTPELLEARMLAAVERLDGPAGFVRPRLSPTAPAEWAGLPAPAATSREELAAAPRAAVAEQAPIHEPAPEEARPAPVPPQPVDTSEVVLPVPPMDVPADTRRRGLRRRGRAG